MDRENSGLALEAEIDLFLLELGQRVRDLLVEIDRRRLALREEHETAA